VVLRRPRSAATDAVDRRAAGWLRTGCALAVVAGVLPVVVSTTAPGLLVMELLLALLALVLVIVLLFRYASRPWAVPGEVVADPSVA
jgi:hypothetical protein